MDYKYIEQLVDRYFQALTTLEEEAILKAFFAQQSVPPSLAPYKALFVYEQQEAHKEPLGADFDARILQLIEQDRQQAAAADNTDETIVVKAKTVRLADRLRPLFRAAAVVAIILTLGNAVEWSMGGGNTQSDEINYADYKDTYDDPTVAYDNVEDALRMVQQGLLVAAAADSIAATQTEQQDTTTVIP